jgi:cystathionine gamma-synthase
VHYPGLPDHPEYQLAQRQMPSGAGGVVAFELADGTAAGRCEEAVRLVRNATSLGGVESLIERRARIEPDGRVPEGLLRLAVGLEDVDDLWADLAQAIEASQRSAAASSTTSAASSPIS